MIVPSVGRKVWYFETPDQIEPMDATVIKVHAGPEGKATENSLLNLFVIDANGNTSCAHSVPPEADDRFPQYRWMPYQLGQAAKVEQEKKGS